MRVLRLNCPSNYITVTNLRIMSAWKLEFSLSRARLWLRRRACQWRLPPARSRTLLTRISVSGGKEQSHNIVLPIGLEATDELCSVAKVPYDLNEVYWVCRCSQTTKAFFVRI